MQARQLPSTESPRWEINQQRSHEVFENIDELITTIDRYIATNDRETKPFVWTAIAQFFLHRVSTLCERTSHLSY